MCATRRRCGGRLIVYRVKLLLTSSTYLDSTWMPINKLTAEFPVTAGLCLPVSWYRPQGWSKNAEGARYRCVLASLFDNHAQAAFHAGILAGTRVLLGCEVFPNTMHRQYFLKCIEPLVQQNARNGLPHYRYLEPLNEEPMQRWLVRANRLAASGARAGVSRAIQLNCHRPLRGAAAGGSIWLAA